ncbi:DUF1707 SHOCT-like domain-containing protein [Streptomyces sp. enrichment culture]|uniref:DUF1707 SHOCT-like domain-containing protein n=1 Tax=Streptomyces sp. enrichment culture TaxID=1795815 RepID=UPI003F570F23
MDLQKQSAAPTTAAELRCSDADRDRIADILREALAEGRLTPDEHAERVAGALAARTAGELEAFIRDLPAAHIHRAATPTAPYASLPSGPYAAPSRPTAGAIPIDPDDNVVAVLGAAVRKGRWRAGRRIHAYAVFGSVEIDLSEALFEYQQVVIKAFSVFGSVEISVPENVSLRGTGGGVLGSFEVDPLDATDSQAPVVFVDGWAVLGSVEARPRRGKRVADILDRVQRKTEKTLRRHLGH